MSGRRVVVLGCVAFSQRMLAAAVATPGVEVAGVVSRAASPGNADFHPLADDADALGLPAHRTDIDGGDDAAIVGFVRGCDAAVGLCVGWSRLLSDAVLAAPTRGWVGFHPAELPNNRGRHPIIWALALGLDRTASTFFELTARADDGAIVDQAPIAIDAADDAGALYAKISDTAAARLQAFLPRYLDGAIAATPQQAGSGNAWRKRGPADGRIDWRMSGDAIRNLVRALARPYPGATVRIGDADRCVWRVSLATGAPANVEPGRVLAVDGDRVLIKAWDCGVWLEEHEAAGALVVGDWVR